MKPSVRLWLFVSAVLVISLSAAQSPAWAQGPSQVCGAIWGKNLQGDLRTLNGNVTARSGSAAYSMTTFDGFYCLFIPAGTYTLTAAAPGYKSHSTPLTVTGAAISGIDFHLDPSGEPIPEFPTYLPLVLAVAIFLARRRLGKRAIER